MSADFNFSNVKINLCLTPVTYILLYLMSIHYNRGYAFWIITDKNHGTAILGCLVYIWCSRFFQPDLDHPLNRPGKTTFPLGETFAKATSAFLKNILLPLAKRAKSAHFANIAVYGLLSPLAKIWFYLWAPYATLLTHRGISHWPIIGTLTRIWYLHFFVLLLEILFQRKLPVLTDFLDNFYFWKSLDPKFFILCAPIFISDIFHSCGDGVESLIKGYSFCPPAIRRGWISKVLRITV